MNSELSEHVYFTGLLHIFEFMEKLFLFFRYPKNLRLENENIKIIINYWIECKYIFSIIFDFKICAKCIKYKRMGRLYKI